MHRMDANPCACETSRSQLSHAQGFISISLTVASECSIENVENLKFLNLSPEFTAFSCRKIKTNRRASEERECIVRSPILVRWKAQGLNFPTHKDSYPYLAPLRQKIQLKVRYFHNFQDFSPTFYTTRKKNSQSLDF